jgi:hypothetical protein
MKREQDLVAQFMYSANHNVKTDDTPPSADELRICFCLMHEEVTALFEAKNIIAMAEALGDIIYTSLWTSNHLNLTPFPQFATLKGVMTCIRDDMQRDDEEVNFVPLVTRDAYKCLHFEQQISNKVAWFINTNEEAQRLDFLTLVIRTTCVYSHYLGLPLPKIFDEIHASHMTKLIDGHQDEHGKWYGGEAYLKPKLEQFFLPT